MIFVVAKDRLKSGEVLSRDLTEQLGCRDEAFASRAEFEVVILPTSTTRFVVFEIKRVLVLVDDGHRRGFSALQSIFGSVWLASAEEPKNRYMHLIAIRRR